MRYFFHLVNGTTTIADRVGVAFPATADIMAVVEKSLDGPTAAASGMAERTGWTLRIVDEAGREVALVDLGVGRPV